MPPTVNELDRRLARIERMFQRGRVLTANPLPGATPEAYLVDAVGRPLSAETGQVMPFPGCVANPIAGSEVVVAFLAGGQDPVIVAGTASPVAQRAIAALAATLPPGSLVIADAALGVNGLAASPTGLDLFGNVTVNGAGIPT